MSEFQPIETLPTDALTPLLAASSGEGFRFLERLACDWQDGNARFDRQPPIRAS